MVRSFTAWDREGKETKLLAVKDQLAVHLIGDDIEVGLHAHLGNGLQVRPAVNHTGGVGGTVEDEGLGLGGDGLAELLGVRLKPEASVVSTTTGTPPAILISS